ncbi:hypothetical protein [Thalassoroseus pseudoceratinae]|uniref:hypothetical protein n=1 Tax=Thalassoroseus pseudoceratinae TaxID=2713176 RepID=UPI00142046ED|nr:hypothetical protein [Thalassoroseus pseudoceratinae]
MRYSIPLIAFAIGGFWFVDSRQGRDVQAEVPVIKPVQQFMRQKLKLSSHVLEGLVVEDFKQLSEAARELKTMSLATDWQVIRSSKYDQYSREFRSTTDQLSKAASEKNIDGAALAHVRMLMTCIRCHEHIRGAEVTSLPRDNQIQHVLPSNL